jgi:ribokinase
MRILNFGSLNLDYVYQVEHFVRPGETLAALSRDVKAGGKGLNQSVALARAGAPVCHAGCLGTGGEILKNTLDENGADTSLLLPVEEMQGHTVIQVDREGENSILLYGGSNRCVTEDYTRRVISRFEQGDWLILQNEISGLPQIVELAAEKGMHIALNPSPYDRNLEALDYSKLDWLLVNEIEAEQISGEKEPDMVWEKLHKRYPNLSLLLTLGKAGSIAWHVAGHSTEVSRKEAVRVKAVDTTAAGDTYTGYFVYGLIEGKSLSSCMDLAGRAAAIAVTRSGAAGSIPWKKELDSFLP